jgi:hypothetical protein
MKRLLEVGRAVHGHENNEAQLRRSEMDVIVKAPSGEAEHYERSNRKLDELSHASSLRPRGEI